MKNNIVSYITFSRNTKKKVKKERKKKIPKALLRYSWTMDYQKL